MKSSVKMLRKQRIMPTRVSWFIRVSFLIFIISCLFFLPNAEAYLEEVNKVSCPVCGAEVKIFKTLSMTVSGSYRDFQRRIKGYHTRTKGNGPE